MGRTTYEATRERLRPKTFPNLHRMVWTRQPERWATDLIPGTLEFSSAEPAAVTKYLRELGKKRCALLGGGETNAAWWQAGLVDELQLTIEPVLFGTGTPLIASVLPTPPPRPLELIDATPLGDRGAILLRYRISAGQL